MIEIRKTEIYSRWLLRVSKHGFTLGNLEIFKKWIGFEKNYQSQHKSKNICSYDVVNSPYLPPFFLILGTRLLQVDVPSEVVG